VIAEAGDEDPRDHGPEAVGNAEQGEADAHHEQGPGSEHLEGEAVEQGGEDDEQQPARLPDGGDIPELRVREMQGVREEVGDDVGLGVVAEAVQHGHEGKQHKAPLGWAAPGLMQAVGHTSSPWSWLG